MIDAIIVGSGASAVHATWALLHAPSRPARVLMLDVGRRDDTYAPLIPDQPWSHLRRADVNQHRYLLGDSFEGIGVGPVRVGAQLTPPRTHITRDTERLNPAPMAEFGGMQSLAQGGLAAGWGAGVARFDAQDLAGSPLALDDLRPHYEAVERRIGISGAHDDLSEPLTDHAGMMPPMAVDTGSGAILRRYQRQRAAMLGAGLRLGTTRLAACSMGFTTSGGASRGPHRLDDLDFFADKTRAVYRPQWTLDELKSLDGFEYRPVAMVRSFTEDANGTVRVTMQNADTGAAETIHTRALVLCAGVLGTAPIVLRSMPQAETSLPLVCNPYTYAPCLNLNSLGIEWSDRRHSLSQLTGVFQPRTHPLDARYPANPAPLHLSIYSYRSLLTFKLMKEMPLGAPIARRLARTLMPLLSILGIHHADAPTPAKTLSLVRGSGVGTSGGVDRLDIRYALGDDERFTIERTEQALLRATRRLGLVVLTRIRPGAGSSIHYAGTLPMAHKPGPMQCSPRGLLHGTRSVYIADGSLLRSLPAKGLTLTLMANADRIGGQIATELARRADTNAPGTSA